MQGVRIFLTIYMNMWVCVYFVYGTKNIYPFQTGQLLKEPDYNGATPQDKERAEEKKKKANCVFQTSF